MGVGTNDLVTILHEIALSSVAYTPNNQNYSANPLYSQSSSADYSYSAFSSPASRQHPSYGSLVVPNPLHRYVGFLDVALTRNLGVGALEILVPYEPLIVTSFSEIRIVGTDSLNEGIILTAKEFSYNITPEQADSGAIGLFILDPTIHPSGVVVAGNYSVQYARPVDLGTTLPPYYLEADISYVVDASAEVLFDTLTFEKDSIGGQVEFAFQVADSVENLQVAGLGESASTSPISIDQHSTTNVGRAIQINAKLKGNDSSFSSDLVVLFPVLESFSLNYLPAKDSTEYQVLSLIRNTIQDETNILLDRPISTDTYTIVGADDTLELFVRKKIDNYDPSSEFLLATIKGISVGDTFVVAKGDLVTKKTSPSPSDLVRVDYLSYNNAQESLYFIQDGSQTTKNMYSEITEISHTITQDRQVVLPSTQTIQVSSITQPDTGATYNASYAFQAPLEGETLTISYNYNATIRDASEAVELKKSLFTDVLVKQIKQVQTGVSPLSVQSQVSLAISELFTSTLADTQTTRRLDASDLIRATSDISGIENIKITTLSRNLITGEIQDPVIYEKRESAILEEGSPRINTSQNGKTLTLESN
jgi:hypothetical protein